MRLTNPSNKDRHKNQVWFCQRIVIWSCRPLHWIYVKPVVIMNSAGTRLIYIYNHYLANLHYCKLELFVCVIPDT